MQSTRKQMSPSNGAEQKRLGSEGASVVRALAFFQIVRVWGTALGEPHAFLLKVVSWELSFPRLRAHFLVLFLLLS
jgi:hypothetical protein